MDVLCIGHASWDISMFVDDFPAENSKCEISAMLECGGGPAANAAYLLSRWGASCGIAASIGVDSYGDRIAEEFLELGVNMDWLDRHPKNVTPVSVILVNQRNGSRTIVNRKVISRDFTQRLSAHVPHPPPRVLLFDGHEPQASLEAMRLFPNAVTILDAGSLRPGTRELAPRVDHLVASERFACQWSGQPSLDSPANQAAAIASLHKSNGRPVIITRGERDVLFGTADRFEQQPTFRINVVDTTAAGDVFHGAFAYAVLNGQSIRESLRWAAAAGAISVTMRGGRSSTPSIGQVQELLRHAG
jgi:sulfofructose kinase